ncbi:fatty acyl-CoA reductase 1 [Venturia canescens]|uniref:fatty acyl-CoA reductase 1 n=1 Tax=Venturia canescens TaxID=32260 RepID=UPI001C9C6056|nr:fatty acyl-CoA reductase 1 [Venturia canescens]
MTAADAKGNQVPDRIAEMFEGRQILLTGGTGFLGKVTVEKFLRCVPNVGKIYLLVRPKKGKDPKQRLDEIFNSPLFEKVRDLRGLSDLHESVAIVNGDVAAPNLGLSPEDRKMLCERINIVYHAAATVRFDESLKKAVLLNTRGTRNMIELAKVMKELVLFAHISTSYCHLEEKILREKPYPPPADPHKIIKCVEWMDDEVVEAMTEKILGTYPNTYAFTKALSEGLVEEAMPLIPAIILRPSIIIPVWKEPIPGWTDNINGPTGLLIGAGKGVIRTMYCQETGYADYLPVDVAVNAIFACTWNFLYFNEQDKRVYNLTSSSEFKVSWREIIDRGRRITEKVPLNNVVWYPGGSMKSSRFVHNICVLFFHMIPAYFIDTLIFLAGYKPILCRVHRRIQKGFEVFEYYANNQWDFDNKNLTDLREKFNATERERYALHGDDLDLDSYFEDCIRAARIYILKEMPETLPAARRHMRIMWWVDVFAKILFFALLIYALACWSESFRTLLGHGWQIVRSALSH